MENTTNPLFAAVTAAVDAHINSLIEARLKTINEAAITEYVQKAITARLGDTSTNMQIMATLDAQLEAKIKGMIDAAIYEHNDSKDHPTSEAIRSVVDDMDLTDNLTSKIEEIVGETDMSSNLESAIESYLDDHNYAKEEYVDEKLDNIEDNDGFKSAVRDTVREMNFEVTVARY